MHYEKIIFEHMFQSLRILTSTKIFFSFTCACTYVCIKGYDNHFDTKSSCDKIDCSIKFIMKENIDLKKLLKIAYISVENFQ